MIIILVRTYVYLHVVVYVVIILVRMYVYLHVVVYVVITCICLHVVGEVVVTLLDSEDVELVYAACGVLLNLMAVQELRHLLTDNRGIKKYVHVCTCMYACMYMYHAISCTPVLVKFIGSWEAFCREAAILGAL